MYWCLYSHTGLYSPEKNQISLFLTASAVSLWCLPHQECCCGLLPFCPPLKNTHTSGLWDSRFLSNHHYSVATSSGCEIIGYQLWSVATDLTQLTNCDFCGGGEASGASDTEAGQGLQTQRLVCSRALDSGLKVVLCHPSLPPCPFPLSNH